MKPVSRAVIIAATLSFALLAGGCSDTWQGVKKDTGENLNKAGEIVVKAGEKLKNE